MQQEVTRHPHAAMLQKSGSVKKKRVVQFAPSPEHIIPINNDELTSNNLTHNFFSPNLGEQGSIRFRSREDRTRTAREAGISTKGTVSNPDFADTLRRVSVVVQQHILRGERLKRKFKMTAAEKYAAKQGRSYNSKTDGFRGQRSPEMSVSFSAEGHVDLTGDRRLSLPRPAAVQLSVGGRGGGNETKTASLPNEPRISMSASLPVSERLAASSCFHEDLFVKPAWKYTFVRPAAGGLFLTNYCMDKVKKTYKTPEVSEIHGFINNLFLKGQVSLLCSSPVLFFFLPHKIDTDNLIFSLSLSLSLSPSLSLPS